MKLLTRIKRLLKKSKPAYRSGWIGSGQSFITISSQAELNVLTGKAKGKKRARKKPVEIFKEILSEVPKMDLTNLDEQIKIVKARKKVLKDYIGETSLEDENLAIEFLKARKKYLKYKDEFGWAVTFEEKIDKLCKKYEVTLVNLSSYYKCVPMEGVKELEKFVKAYEKVSNNEPFFQLIIDEGGKEQKKDPILLASSPFGRWYYVLGAWDKEVIIVDALIYRGK